MDASKIADLQHALVDMAGRGHQLQLANVLRAARGELARLETAAADRVRAADADPVAMAKARAELPGLGGRCGGGLETHERPASSMRAASRCVAPKGFEPSLPP